MSGPCTALTSTSAYLASGSRWEGWPESLAAEFRHLTRLNPRIGERQEADDLQKGPFGTTAAIWALRSWVIGNVYPSPRFHSHSVGANESSSPCPAS